MKKILSLLAICAMAVTSAWASTDPDYVEIGGLRWATMNVGATTVTGTTTNPESAFGTYYSWGATSTIVSSIPWSSWTAWGTRLTPTFISGKEGGYIQANDPLWNGSAWTYSPATGKTRSENFDSHDAAKTVLGGSWRMPSADEFKALADACGSATTYSSGDITEGGIYWISPTKGSSVTIDGVAYSVPGNLFVSSTDKTKRVFFPAAGYMGFNNVGATLFGAGTCGHYWSSSLYDTDKAYDLYFSDFTFFFASQSKDPRYYGQSVRAVQDIPTPLTFDETATYYSSSFEEGKTYDITINRTMKAGRWNTLMLPFDMTSDEIKSNFGENAKVMKMTDIKNNVVSFETATTIEYDKAYIVEPATDITKIEVKDKTVPETNYSYTDESTIPGFRISCQFCQYFIPIFERMIMPYYVLSNNNFYKLDSEETINGYRWVIADNSGANARALTLSLDGVATGINEVEGLNGYSQAHQASQSNGLNGLNGKFIEDGRMVIVKDSKKFNAAGQNIK